MAAALTRYEKEIRYRTVFGSRIPGWLNGAFTEDDGVTARDVSSDQFVVTLSKGDVSFELVGDDSGAAAGYMTWALDTTVSEAEVGIWDWDLVWLMGSDSDTDPVYFTVGGTIDIQQNVSEVPS